MKGACSVFRRELTGYFVTPVAYVFIVIFLVLAGVATFQLGNLFERGQADLLPFFGFLPWLYLFLIPALSMRLWAEERKSGTIELLLTLPITPAGAVVGKYLAAWVFAGISLALTFPLWITLNKLGSPDNGAILTGYLGSLLMAGGFLAIGSTVSAATKSQVIAFVISVVLCFAMLLLGFSAVQDFFSGWVPAPVMDTLSTFSFMTQFDMLSRGVIEARSIVFFVSLIGCLLVANVIIVETRRGA
ncbi:MAG: ABC transporter permease subunit [Phycisphaeraceae bacterium]|nr:MAG: ABC transporter permease subunit [Phycisphaeraceae bacterium]